MKNAGLDESKAGIQITRRNINNLRNAEHHLMAESEEELKSLLMKVKETIQVCSKSNPLQLYSENDQYIHGIRFDRQST